jgi:group I intron endonuclease
MEDRYTLYKHTNLINGKVYFGLTKNTMEERAKKDGSAYKQCTYFYNAIQKYGWDNFSHEVVAELLPREQASFYEKTMIKVYRANEREYGYNIQPGGLHAGGMSPEGFERFIHASMEANKKPVVSFSREGKRLMWFDSAQSAADHYGVSHSLVDHALRRGNHTCKNMLFRWSDEVTDFVDMPEDYLNKYVRVRHYKAGKHAKCANVVLFDREGKRIKEFESSKECAQYLGIGCSGVSGVLMGRHNTVCGCYVRLKADVGDAESICVDGIDQSNRMGVALVDEVGNEIQTFVSLTQAAKSVGGDSKALKKAATDGRPYHGKLWRLL